MKRITSLLLAVLALSIVAVAAVQAQDQYQQGTTAQQPSGTVEQQPAAAADPAMTAPATDLPATASPMPLVALGGLVSMAAGAVLSRRRRKA